MSIWCNIHGVFDKGVKCPRCHIEQLEKALDEYSSFVDTLLAEAEAHLPAEYVTQIKEWQRRLQPQLPDDD